MIKTAVFTIITVAALAVFVRSLLKITAIIKLGQKEDRFDEPAQRFLSVLKIAFGQSKLLREPIAGAVHFIIFWGFLLLGIGVFETFAQGFYSEFNLSFTGHFYLLVTASQEIFGAAVLVSLIIAVYRRYIQKIPRLQTKAKSSYDALFILGMISIVVISMFGQNAASLASLNYQSLPYEWRTISSSLGRLLFNENAASANSWHEIFWWIHVTAILSFLNYLPFSKHFHIISSVPNVFFAKLAPQKNAIRKLNLEDETAETFGADDVNKLTWKQLLDGFACTECGRCESACPAANTGKSLSPRKIITDVRARANEAAPFWLKGIKEGKFTESTLLRSYITETELWQCTTCAACVQECPVMIEHIDTIIDIRRHLVLTESNFPPELNALFRNLEVNGSPWAFNKGERAAWADGMEILTMSEDPECEYLFWVGCAGSFDNRYKNVSRAFASIMQKAGVSFRILGAEEKCNGDTARRLGNEYLAQQLMMENVETLNNYGVKKIVTACPHCFNSLSREYPQFGGNYQVIHHSELIDSLIKTGKIKLKPKKEAAGLTYHDSCYLGRYNELYQAPRDIISSATGASPVEMARNRTRGFCCGAGGGRMFLEDVEGGRINEERVKEALSLDVTSIATACPFCMTMMTDGLKALEKNDSVMVKDIAEIIYDNLE